MEPRQREENGSTADHVVCMYRRTTDTGREQQNDAPAMVERQSRSQKAVKLLGNIAVILPFVVGDACADEHVQHSTAEADSDSRAPGKHVHTKLQNKRKRAAE